MSDQPSRPPAESRRTEEQSVARPSDARRRMGRYLKRIARNPWVKSLRQLPGAQSLYHALGRTIGPSHPEGQVWLEHEGFEILVDPRDHVGNSLFRYNEYEPGVTAILKARLGPGDTAVDVGAHYGSHTLSMRRAVGPSGHVVSVEPNSDVAAALEWTVERNGLGTVTVVEAAASDEEGRRTLRVPDRAARDRSVVGEDDNPVDETPTARYDVRCVPLSALLGEMGVGSVTLLKVDVEGHELSVLEGLGDALSTVETLLLEIHTDRLDGGQFEDLVGLLRCFHEYRVVDPAVEDGGTSVESPAAFRSVDGRLLLCSRDHD